MSNRLYRGVVPEFVLRLFIIEKTVIHTTHTVSTIVEVKSPSGALVERKYVVQPGDTILEISRKLDYDYRRLLDRNRIPSPYLLFPGQVIHY